MLDLELKLDKPFCDCKSYNGHIQYENKSQFVWNLDTRINHKNNSYETDIIVKCLKCNMSIRLEHPLKARFVQGWSNNPIHQFENKPLTNEERKKLDALLDEADGKIIKVYPDEFYWINLSTSFSRYESYMLNHCGKDERGELWSLRNPNKIPFITLVVKNKEALQIRGKNNNPPSEKYMAYVNDLIQEGSLRELGSEILSFINKPKNV